MVGQKLPLSLATAVIWGGIDSALNFITVKYSLHLCRNNITQKNKHSISLFFKLTGAIEAE